MTGLEVRGVSICSAPELELMRSHLLADLGPSATLRNWLEGESVPPHSVAVSVETALRMCFGEPPELCALLDEIIQRLADEFPAEVQPLETS